MSILRGFWVVSFLMLSSCDLLSVSQTGGSLKNNQPNSEPPNEDPIDDFKKPGRIFAFQILHAGDSGSVETRKKDIDEMIELGANAVHLVVSYDQIFKTKEEQTKNDDSSWYVPDSILKHVASKPDIGVILRVSVDVDDNITRPGKLWNLNDCGMKDQWGMPAQIDYGSGTPSFYCSEGINLQYDFIKKVTERYYKLLGDRFFAIGITQTAQKESAMNFENNYSFQNNSGDWVILRYPAMYDYSDSSIRAFRQFIQKKYSNVTNLNQSWGSGYSSFDEANPPSLAVSAENRFSLSNDHFRVIWNGNKGHDWYTFLFSSLLSYYSTAKTLIKAIHPKVEFIGEFGGVIDGMSRMRMTYDISEFSKVFDYIKTGPSMDLFKNDPTMDYLQSNLNYGSYTEIADFDGKNYDRMIGVANYSFERGMVMVSIITSSSNPDRFEYSKKTMKNMVLEWKDKKVNSTHQFQGEMSVKLSDLYRNYESFLEQWRNQSDYGNKSIKINLIKDF